MSNINKYTEIDAFSPDGTFTQSGGHGKYDMRGIRDYCKKNNRNPESLTDVEMRQFENREKLAK